MSPMIDAIRSLAQAKVRFVVIGGQAIRLLGFPRTTQDWDLFIPPKDSENLARINSVLDDELDMPVIALGPNGENFIQTYQTQWGIIQFHLGVPGVPDYEEAERAAIMIEKDGVKIKRLNGKMLLQSKLKTGRSRDQEDIEFLKELEKAGRLI